MILFAQAKKAASQLLLQITLIPVQVTGERALTQGVAMSMGREEGMILKTNSEVKWIGGTNALTREKRQVGLKT